MTDRGRDTLKIWDEDDWPTYCDHYVDFYRRTCTKCGEFEPTLGEGDD